MATRYVKSFQGLRVIAALMVFAAHAGFGVGFGSFGVVIFFVLSGFLAQMKYTQSQQGTNIVKACLYNLWRGYKKYFPLHFIMLLAVSVLTYRNFINDTLPTILCFFANLFLLQCWSPNRAVNISFNGLSWFLSALMFCLLLSPAVVRFFARGTWKRAAIALFLIIAIQFGMALGLNNLSHVNIFTCSVTEVEDYKNSVAFWLTYIFPPTRLLNYAMGCALFSVCERIKDKMNAVWSTVLLFLSIALGALALFFCYGRDSIRLFDVAVWCIPTCGAIFALFCEDLPKQLKIIFSNRAMLFFGSFSFEFYMVHEFILRCARAGYRLIGVQSTALYVLSSFVASVCIAILVHFIRVQIKKKLAYRGQKSLPNHN